MVPAALPVVTISLHGRCRELSGPQLPKAAATGLHKRTRKCRWSIEGAIGSKHKVDASYLSPNVNMAARLETATKQYGVAILMSADFAALLSPRMRARCRQIDIVIVKGSSQPMGIWTIDTDTRFIVSDGRRAFQDNLKFVHDSQTTAAAAAPDALPVVVQEGTDEFDVHPDVQNSYAADTNFLNTWKVRMGLQPSSANACQPSEA